MSNTICKAFLEPSSKASVTTALSELLAESRERCEVDYRIDRGRRAGPNLLTPGELKTVKEPLDLLSRVARPELEALLAKLAPANYVVVLSDANGVAIDFVANSEPDSKLRHMGVCAGATWGETHVGTNGIGTSILARSPIVVHQRNHFLLKYADLTCTAAPLFDSQGRVIASLDASSVANLPQEVQWLVLDLVVQTARRIERLYFLERHRNRSILTVDQGAGSLQPKPVFMLAVGEDGCVIDVQGNSDDASDTIKLKDFRQKNLSNLLESVLQSPSVPTSATHVEHRGMVSLFDDVPCFAVLRSPSSGRPVRPLPAGPKTLTSITRGRSSAKKALTLDRLAGSDQNLQSHVDRIRRFKSHCLPFLIQGETGTGKEEFARAIHAHGPRATGPFIAIDCSSIPENLIESELFGYEAGTFTGGRREGRRGRILDAHGGTLLLDEIGDMPFPLQTRLLRVLAQNEIIPLGGHVPVKVDFNLICATHQDLKSLVAQNRFRQDLYFRIAGYKIRLPPLRARTDKEEIILGALAIESDHAGRNVAPNITAPALAKLMSHTWPGNMRELRLVLRYALAISGAADIEVSHLPADLVEEPSLRPAAIRQLDPLGLDLAEVLRRNDWSVTKAAKELRVSRQTVHRRMSVHKLKRPS